MGDSDENLLIRIEMEGAAEAATEVDALGDSVEGLGVKMDETSAKSKGFAGGLASLKTLIAGLAVAKAVKSFASFQSQMERLRTQTNATQAEVSRMSKGILSMAVSVGTGPQSLAEALYHIESAGFRGQKALDALRIAAEGAKVGNADLVDTTTALTAVLVAGMAKGKNSVAEMKSAMGELNATVGAGDMTFEDLNKALSTGVLATFAQMGLKVKDLGAALAVLGDSNIRGSKAANILRMGLMQLVHPSQAVGDAMASIGLKNLQLANDMRKPNGLLVMLEDLKNHLGALNTNAEKTKATDILGGIFGGGRNSSGMLTLLTQMDRLKSKYADIEKSGNDFNSEWQQTTKTLQFVLDQIETLGQVILIKLGGAINSLVPKIEKFVDDFRKGVPWARFLGVALLSVAAGFIALKVATLAWSVVMGIAEAMPLVELFTALGIAIYLVVTHFQQIKAVASEVFAWLKSAVVDAANWVKDHWILVGVLTGPFGLLVTYVATHFNQVKSDATTLWHELKSVWNSILSDIKTFVNAAGSVLDKLFSPLKTIMGGINSLSHGGGSLLGKIEGAFADGTPSVQRSGSYLVGERGPEIVNLPVGASVIPNGAIGAAGTGGVPLLATIVNVVQLDGQQVGRSTVRQGLMAQERRGFGGQTLTDVG